MVKKRLFFSLSILLVYILFFLQKPQDISILSKDLQDLITSPTKAPVIVSEGDFILVVKVVDGDTIKVDLSTAIETIRMIGIDTPEVVDPRKIVECFGKEASSKTKEILSGKKIRLVGDPTQGDRDKYQRILRYVFLEDGTNVNKLLIEEGYAHEYTYQSNPYQYQVEFKEAEKQARENKKGLWADNACPK